MSYDLAVWEGEPPADDAAAGAEFKRLYRLYVEEAAGVAPTQRIAGYVAALLERYPDISTAAGADSPWSTGSLLGEASGPLVYFPMVWSRCDEVSAWAARLAGAHGLNCFDPQQERLRTPAAVAWRFELTSAAGEPVREPGAQELRQTLVRLSDDNFFAVLSRWDDWYVQAGYGERAGTRPGWYALERRDGSPDKHFRVEVADVDEVIRAFVAFREGDPALATGFAWQPY